MLLPCLSNGEAGAVAEAYVMYKLQRWGEIVVRPDANLPYDLVVLRDRPVKIQVKSRRSQEDYVYKFQTTHGTTTRPYKEEDFDFMAVVALDIERTIFVPHTTKRTLTIHEEEFRDGQELRTWYQMLDKIGLS